MDINLQNKKIEVIQWLSHLKDESVINKIMRLRENEKEDWWIDIARDERASLEQGLKDADSGTLKSHSEARKLYERWL